MLLKSGSAVAVSQCNFGSTAQKLSVSLFQIHVDCWGFRGSSWDQHQLFTLLAINCRGQGLVWCFVFYCPHILAPGSVRLVSTCEPKSYSCSQLSEPYGYMETPCAVLRRKHIFQPLNTKFHEGHNVCSKEKRGTKHWPLFAYKLKHELFRNTTHTHTPQFNMVSL